MLELDVVQAAFGDCLLVRYGTTRTRKTILIDGGPSGTYAKHLRGLLTAIAADRRDIDLAVLSHIDNDHVKGLLDLFAELHDTDEDPAGDGQHLPTIKELWHNAFSVSAGGPDIAPRIREALATAGGAAPRLRTLAGTLMGVGEGDALRVAAQSLGVPINLRFGSGPVMLDGSAAIRVGGIRLDVLGPSTRILEKLRKEWLGWLTRHERAIAGGRSMAAAADQKTPNLSSIVILLRARGRSVLFTGDGRGDHILDGLRERRLLKADGTLHVDVLKVPHHGSSRNASPEFFRTVTADRYVISANGRYGNPDLDCLLWMVDAAAGRLIEIICTNDTDSLAELRRQRPPKRSGYRLTIAAPDAPVHTIVLE
ncbi:MBL fold metallo-hydrolase [soil metagenome]